MYVPNFRGIPDGKTLRASMNPIQKKVLELLEAQEKSIEGKAVLEVGASRNLTLLQYLLSCGADAFGSDSSYPFDYSAPWFDNRLQKCRSFELENKFKESSLDFVCSTAAFEQENLIPATPSGLKDAILIAFFSDERKKARLRSRAQKIHDSVARVLKSGGVAVYAVSSGSVLFEEHELKKNFEILHYHENQLVLKRK